MTGVWSRAALLMLLAAILGWLAYNVSGNRPLPFDIQIRQAIHEHATPALTRVMIVLSAIGEPYVLWPLGGLAFYGFWRAGLKDSAVLFAIAMCGVLANELILKYAVHRSRPEAFFGYPLPTSYSFPSGHAAQALTWFGTLAALISALLHSTWMKILLWLAGAAMIVGIGFSRIYLGVHYPTDVVAGYLAGLFWVLAIEFGNHVRKGRVKRT